MRAALLLSGLFLICGVAAYFGIPAVLVDGQAIVGVRALVASLIFAVVPPVAVLAWRKVVRK